MCVCVLHKVPTNAHAQRGLNTGGQSGVHVQQVVMVVVLVLRQSVQIQDGSMRCSASKQRLTAVYQSVTI